MTIDETVKKESVKEYSKEIVERAKELVPCNFKLRKGVMDQLTALACGVTYAGATFLPSAPLFGNPIYHLSGLVSHMLARHTSHNAEAMVADWLGDEFFDYGLDKHYEDALDMERNVFRRRRDNPFFDELTLLCAVIPPFAYGEIMSLPLLYTRNKYFAEQIKIAIGIGAEVEEMINKGSKHDDIVNAIKEYDPSLTNSPYKAQPTR